MPGLAQSFFLKGLCNLVQIPVFEFWKQVSLHKNYQEESQQKDHGQNNYLTDP